MKTTPRPLHIAPIAAAFATLAAAPAHGGAAADLARANAAAAIDLYHAVARSSPGTDVVLGPHSIAQAMALAEAGADGGTRDEIRAAFHWSALGDQLHPAWKDLSAQLAQTKGVELAIANRLYLSPSDGFRDDYRAACLQYHDATPEVVDFAKTEPARQRINAWVSGQTRSRIPELLPPGSIDAATSAVLANACYFLGRWSTPFDPTSTERDATFHTPSGDTPCAMMSRKGPLAWARADAAQIAKLPYGPNPAGAHMLLVVPEAKDGLPAIERILSPDTLARWDAALRTSEARVELPRFTTRTRADLVEALRSLGVRKAFSGGADFSRMADSPMSISKVMHQAWIATDEAGTEAAAATAVVMTRTAMKIEPVIRADRPFLYLIREDATGAILFLGRVTSPQDPGPAK